MMLPVQATTHQSLLGESRGLRLRHLCASGANPTALRVRRRAHASGGSQADRVAIEKCPQRNRLTAAPGRRRSAPALTHPIRETSGSGAARYSATETRQRLGIKGLRIWIDHGSTVGIVSVGRVLDPCHGCV